MCLPLIHTMRNLSRRELSNSPAHARFDRNLPTCCGAAILAISSCRPLRAKRRRLSLSVFPARTSSGNNHHETPNSKSAVLFCTSKCEQRFANVSCDFDMIALARPSKNGIFGDISDNWSLQRCD
jgi:hypothetical protein